VFSPLLVLTQVNNNAQNHKTIKKEAGLYHFAMLLTERRFLASFLRHIQKNLDSQYYEGMADHGVSESIYIHDPDFNGIEFYRDIDCHRNGGGMGESPYGYRAIGC
jgi:catechol 2,3-dioxygenase